MAGLSYNSDRQSLGLLRQWQVVTCLGLRLWWVGDVALWVWLVSNGSYVGLRQFGLEDQRWCGSRLRSPAVASCRQRSLENFWLVVFRLGHQWLLDFIYLLIFWRMIAAERRYWILNQRKSNIKGNIILY